MIYIINEGKKLKYSLDDYSEILSIAKKLSEDALMHFFDLIGLDHSLFEHLKDIKLVIDLDEDNDYNEVIAFYENIWEDDRSIDNAIHFLPEYLDSIIEDKSNIKVINDLARTIIHETIHSNRSIIINDGVICNGLISDVDEYEKYVSMFSGFSYKTFNKYKVLKYEKNNYFYTIYSYNTLTGDYNIFSLPSNKRFKGIDELEYWLNKKTNMFCYLCTIENPYDFNPSALVSEYSTSFKNISKINNKNKKNVEIETNKQNGFEECLTEAFTAIIFYLRDKNVYNIDELFKNNYLTPDVKLALNFIKQLDIDTVRWFFLSCYEEEYTNKFYELYKSDYFKLIDQFNEAYDCSMSNENYERFDETLSLIKSLKKSNN